MVQRWSYIIEDVQISPLTPGRGEVLKKLAQEVYGIVMTGELEE